MFCDLCGFLDIMIHVCLLGTPHREAYNKVVDSEKKENPQVRDFNKMIILCPNSCKIKCKICVKQTFYWYV